MAASGEKHPAPQGNSKNQKRERSSSLPNSKSSSVENRKLAVEAVSPESRNSMGKSLTSHTNPQRNIPELPSKLILSTSRTGSIGATNSATKRIQQSSKVVDERLNVDHQSVRGIPPPIYSSNAQERFAGKSTEIPVHLLRSGKNIVTKTITKRQKENGVTEIHITTVTRKLVDNVPSPDATNRTVVLRTVKKGVSPLTGLELSPRPAVDLAFPLEDTLPKILASNGSVDTSASAPTQLGNWRRKSISRRTNYREVQSTDPTNLSKVDKSERQVSTVNVNPGSRSPLTSRITTNQDSNREQRISIESGISKSTLVRKGNTQNRKSITQTPRVTLPENFRRKIAIRGQNFEDSIQIPVANTKDSKIRNIQAENTGERRDHGTAKSIETSRVTRVKTVTKNTRESTKKAPTKASQTEREMLVRKTVFKDTSPTVGITVAKDSRNAQKSQKKEISTVSTRTENDIRGKSDKMIPINIKSLIKTTKQTVTVPDKSPSPTSRNDIKNESRTMQPKQNVEKSLKKKTDMKIETTQVVENKPNETSNRKLRNRLDFSLTNARSNRRPQDRRRRPPRPGKKTLSKTQTSRTISEINPPSVPPVVPSVQGRYHFYKSICIQSMKMLR